QTLLVQLWPELQIEQAAPPFPHALVVLPCTHLFDESQQPLGHEPHVDCCALPQPEITATETAMDTTKMTLRTMLPSKAPAETRRLAPASPFEQTVQRGGVASLQPPLAESRRQHCSRSAPQLQHV